MNTNELKEMTWEDLYFYCKDKNPDEIVKLNYQVTGGFIKNVGLLYDKDNDLIYMYKTISRR